MQNSLFKLFEHKYVLEVCVHIHPIMIKIHPVFFFLNPLSQIRLFWDSCQEWGRLTLDPPWAEWAVNSPTAIVSTPVQGKTRMSPIKRLRHFVVGCNNGYSSRHLLLTSEPLKTQRINVTFIFEGNAPILAHWCSKSLVIQPHLQKKWV